MLKKERNILYTLYQMDSFDLEEWQQDNDVSLFSNSFINEVNDLKEALQTECQAIRDDAMDYYRQEDRSSDDPEIR